MISNNPIFLILSIPRPFSDLAGIKSDALDLEINKVPLLNYLLNLIGKESRKIIITKKINESRFKNLD